MSYCDIKATAMVLVNRTRSVHVWPSSCNSVNMADSCEIWPKSNINPLSRIPTASLLLTALAVATIEQVVSCWTTLENSAKSRLINSYASEDCGGGNKLGLGDRPDRLILSVNRVSQTIQHTNHNTCFRQEVNQINALMLTLSLTAWKLCWSQPPHQLPSLEP